MEDNGEEAVEGAADDADAEFINDTLENHVITGDGLLAKFVYVVNTKACITDIRSKHFLCTINMCVISRFVAH